MGYAVPRGYHPLDSDHAVREAAGEAIADAVDAAMDDPGQIASDVLDGKLPLATALVCAWRHLDGALTGNADDVRAVLEAVRHSRVAVCEYLEEAY